MTMNTPKTLAFGALRILLLVAATAPTFAAEPIRNEAVTQQDQVPSSEPTSEFGPTPPQIERLPTEATDSDQRPRLNAFWDNGPVLESSDKAFRFHFGGRLDFDNSWYNQTPTLPFQLEDGSDMRRGRLRADGSVGENVDFVTEVNFANIQDVTNASTTTPIGSVGLNDFFVTLKQVPIVENVRIGHFKQPIGLEHLTSGNDLYYMERSDGHDAFFQPFQFVAGVMVFDSYFDDRMTAALSVARVGKQTINPFAFGAGPGECAVTGRLTGLLVDQDEGRRLVHMGVGCSYSGTDDHNFEVANRPLVRAGAGSQQIPNILDTGKFFTANPVQLFNAEYAMILGRFSASAEYQLGRATNLFQQFSNGVFSGPRGNVTYQGLYAEVGFFLSPEDYRRYNRKEGVWGRQIVTQESSASEPATRRFFANHMPVQLICRYSYLDLASGQPVLTPSSGAQAGWENDITAGCDWYVNSQVHFIINYVYTHLDYVNHTSGAINGLGCRLHLDF